MESPSAPSTTSAFLDDAAHIIEAYLTQEDRSDAAPPLSIDDAKNTLPIALPRTGLGEAEALRRLAQIVAATPTTSGPRFVNQLFAGRERLATAAEIVTAALNTSMYTFKAAGPQVLIEREVIERMLAKASMTGGDGMFTPGGSLSNLAAMIIARNEFEPESRERGFDGRIATLYVSAESHYSIKKNAGMIGLGRGNVRPVKSDTSGRMIPAELEKQINADRAAGLRPFLIIATSGTTVMGAFDPLPPLADIAQRESLWLHVDGAFGGTALMHPRTRKLMNGIDRADSLTWDAHKAMGVPLTCSVVLTKRPGLMQKHFDESASYLFQQDFEHEQAWLNPGVKSLQCGRRNDALKLWAQWQSLGDDGYESRVAHQMELARTATSIARDDSRFTLSCEPEWLNICFEVTGKSSASICDELERTGTLKVGFGIVNKRRVIRLVTSNPSHTTDDIRRMMNDIAEAGKDMPNADNAVA